MARGKFKINVWTCPDEPRKHQQIGIYKGKEMLLHTNYHGIDANEAIIRGIRYWLKLNRR